MFENLKKNKEIVEDTDRIGFSVLESDMYDFVIESAYLDKSTGGAMSLNFSFANKQGESLRNTQWITSGDAKGNLNTYEDKKGVAHYLPGFNVSNAIVNFCMDMDIADVSVKEKTLKLYDPDAGKETPQKKKVIIGLIGKKITLGIQKVLENKRVQKDKEYVVTSDTVNRNEIDKVFDTETKLTVSEARAGEEEGSFYEKWLEANKGKVIDKRSIKSADDGKGKKGKKKSLFVAE